MTTPKAIAFNAAGDAPVIEVRAIPSFDGHTVAGCEMTALVTLPDLTTFAMDLFDDGDAIHGDVEADDGIYSGVIVGEYQVGPYVVDVVVRNTDGVPTEGEFGNPDDPPPVVTVVPFVRQQSTVAHMDEDLVVSAPNSGSFNRLDIVTPNPAVSDSVVRFSFELPEPGEVEIAVFDVNGRRIAVVDRSAREAGQHWVEWRVQSESHTDLGAGVYFVRVATSNYTRTSKFVLLQ